MEKQSGKQQARLHNGFIRLPEGAFFEKALPGGLLCVFVVRDRTGQFAAALRLVLPCPTLLPLLPLLTERSGAGAF